ncbi:MAG: hypothetical protein VX447_01450 [Pseudomonadota bacterium]|nr:hypothetical protein [Pseudomonadota bacterium]
MNTKELQDSLNYLVNKYISNINKKDELLNDINIHAEEVAKGILSEINKHKDKEIEAVDSDIIKEIVYYYS